MRNKFSFTIVFLFFLTLLVTVVSYAFTVLTKEDALKQVFFKGAESLVEH